ncbi:MAG: diguanylate cyclase [Heliobacteriaceae bacterium]|jgi:diguanylate cyclase (GGDEF)-like protein|nr:diguanylate cyclase [Heliobacteriaceae bacterium]
MDFFSQIKEIYSKINEVENAVYGSKQDYSEIYERNLQLEREIEQRTRELNITNKRILTLQHIWDMMNSSVPLQNILETVMTQGELGYVHSTIIEDYTSHKIFAEAVKNHEIKTTTNARLVLKYITGEKLKKAVSKAGSLIAIPLYIQNKPFGVFIVVSLRSEVSAAEKDFLMMFACQIEMAVTISNLFEALKEQAVTDSLTGLYNRRYFEEQTAKEVVRAVRQKQPFSIIGLDLDYLKHINDKFGHAYGDLAIKAVARILKNNARSIDIVARMGGEEFNVMLPGIDSQGALVAAERFRKAVEECKLDEIGGVTASVGVATFLEHSDNIDEIMELTDQAMYQSKRNGKNRVTMAKPVSEISWQEVAVNTFTDILSKHNIPVAQDLIADLYSKLKKPDSSKEVLYSVSDILARTYNPAHSEGVAKSKNLIAVTLAKRFDLSKEEIDNLRVAMLLYDIGNLMIPSDILQKREPLTGEEKKYIQEHPIIAAREILKPISYIQDVIPIIEHHHENWDGTGYPKHISGDAIPVTSQIVLIIDVYFALIEPRPYRSKLTPDEAVEIIRKDSGKKWNAELVEEFISLIEHENAVPVKG